MKFTHDGTEYEVAELARFLRVKGFGRIDQPWFDAAAALLARHERDRDVFTTALAWFRADCGMSGPEWNAFLTACDRTALRGEEAPRG